ncbi:hypothetical protein LJC15_00230 [Desulfovibrio sp. OttesenSCG-928-G11]|nr:hypothetical protein [Desulfovibrio sp. OttesenSCG-928-G11]
MSDLLKNRLKLAGWVCLWIIILAALAIELLVRPFWPELVKSDSALGEIARLLLGLMVGGPAL